MDIFPYVLEFMMAYKTFEELKVWQQARDLRINISVLVAKLPDKERKLLCWQLIRSSRSLLQTSQRDLEDTILRRTCNIAGRPEVLCMRFLIILFVLPMKIISLKWNYVYFEGK